MKKLNLEKKFLDEIVMRNIAVISALCGLISLVLLVVSKGVELLPAFEMLVKIVITLFTLWAFSRFHWNMMQGLMGGLLFALFYQESFLVLGKLWGETSDFDTYLIMGVQGSLYLSAQSMSFLTTFIIIVNHFIINYSRRGNFGNVIFNQITIIFKILLYLFLIGINMFLNQPLFTQLQLVFEYISDLCLVILVICIETQLDNFKIIRQELLKDKSIKGEQE